MSVVDDSLCAVLDFVLASDGTVIGIAPARGQVELASQIGQPLAETYWFNHNDNDERDLWNLLRDAARGKADRLRVWVRVSEHQLVRCDLLVTPVIGADGEIAHLSARTEPTPSTPRRRAPFEPIVKEISHASTRSTDVLQLQLPVPMMRVDRSSMQVVDANTQMLDFFGLSREKLPVGLIDLVESSERDSTIESLSDTQTQQNIVVRMMRMHTPTEVEFSISTDPNAPDANHLLIAFKDRSTDRLADELRTRAEQLAEQSTRQTSTLRTLERLIEACPTPIGLIEDGRLSHSSKALRQRFDAVAISNLVANKRGNSASDVFPLDEQQSVFGIVGTTPIGLDAIDSSTSFGLASIDLHGRIHHWNATFANWAGESDFNRGLFEALDTESRLALEVSLRKFEGDSQVVTLRFERTSVVSRCEIFPSGNAFILLGIDQSDPQRRISEIERVLASERHLLDSLPLRLIRVDHEGKVMWTNRAGATCNIDDITGILQAGDAEKAAGDNRASEIGYELHALERSESGATFALIDRRENRDLRRQASRLQVLESLFDTDPPIALLELDLQSGITTANCAARSLMNLGDDEPIVLSDLCAPADRVAVERAFYGGFQSENDRIDFEFHLDSTGQKFRAVGRVFFDHDTDPPVPAGAIARLINAEREKVASIERNPITTALFESIPAAVRIFMPQSVRQNGAAINLFGIDQINWRDADAWRSRFNPLDADGNAIASELLPTQRAAQGESTTLEMTINTPQGPRKVRSSVVPVFVEQAVVGCVCIDFDLTDEIELKQKIGALESKINDEAASSQRYAMESARLLEQLEGLRSGWIDQFPVPTMRLDLQGRLRDANGLAWKLLGIDPTPTPFEHFEWFDAHDRPIATDDLLPLLMRQDLNLLTLQARNADASQSHWLEIHKSIHDGTITLLLRDRAREISLLASLSQLQNRINEISSEAEARRLRMTADHHALVTLIQIMCADVDSVAQPLALDRRLPGDAHALARGIADVVGLAHRILDAAVDRPRSIELTLGGRRRSDLVQLAREAVRLTSALCTRLAREVSFTCHSQEVIVDVEPALARHAIVAALLSAIGNTPSRTRIELSVKSFDRDVTIEVTCSPATSMKKTGLMQQFADALARSAGAELQTSDEPGACWTARLPLASEAVAIRPIATRARCVLLIEDHESTSRVISRQLARVGCVVRTVRGAGEARLAMRESGDIDLILCDMSLPDGDPLELMTDLSRQYGVRGVALGAGRESDTEMIREAGFVERLAKPVDLVLLANVIDHAVTMPRREVESPR